MSTTGKPEIKLAGTESKDKMYEPKHKKRLVRVLTVIAYVFSVSLAAITLSLFYIFIYNPDRPAGKMSTRGPHLYNNTSYMLRPDDGTLGWHSQSYINHAQLSVKNSSQQIFLLQIV